MKKVLLTEKQLSNLRTKITEQQIDEKYRMPVKIDYGIYNPKGEFDNIEIESPQITLTFDIYIEYRRYGIGSIYVENVIGPSEIPALIKKYDETTNEETEQEISFKVDWNNQKSEIDQKYSKQRAFITLFNDAEIDWVGIDDTITANVEFVNNSFNLTDIEIHVKSIY